MEVYVLFVLYLVAFNYNFVHFIIKTGRCAFTRFPYEEGFGGHNSTALRCAALLRGSRSVGFLIRERFGHNGSARRAVPWKP